MVTIRKATQEDSVSICQLHIEVIRELTDLSIIEIEDWVSERSPENYTEAIATRDCLVAEDNGTVLVFGQLNCETGEVEGVYVWPLYQERGVTSQLLQELERIAWKAGVRRLRVSVLLNFVSSWSRAGYEGKESGLRHLGSGIELACIHMAKELKC